MITLNREEFVFPEIKLHKPYNGVKPRFTMLVGIPGVGKSTYAESLYDDYTKYISSDKIREELYGDANCQKDHSKVFAVMHEQTLEALKNGYDVVYDATNITRKHRKAILIQLPEYVTKECTIVWAPIEVCVKRDQNRSRTVGVEVINKMLKQFEAPFYDEGFDHITCYVSCKYDEYKYYRDRLKDLRITHDNPHHTADVDVHCFLCGNELSKKDLPNVVKTAGFVHDIGKPFTKTFTNMKGEATDIAHYYGHHSVGAWIAYGLPGNDVVLAWLVYAHMSPFINKKYYNGLDPLYRNWVDVLHEADLAAH